MPDLEGQPAWVVIVVVGLFTIGTVGAAWLGGRSRKRKNDDAAESDAPVLTPSEGVPSLPTGAGGVLEATVNAIIRDADAGRQEVAETRAEMRTMQRRLEDLIEQRDRALQEARHALVRLGECQSAVTDLRRQLGGAP